MTSNNCPICCFSYNENTNVKFSAQCGIKACLKCIGTLKKESEQLYLKSCQECKCFPQGHSINYINDNVGSKLNNICKQHSLTNFYICCQDVCFYQIGCKLCFENHHSEHIIYNITTPENKDQLKAILINERNNYKMETKSNEENRKLEEHIKYFEEEVETKFEMLFQVLKDLKESFDGVYKQTTVKFQDTRKVETQFKNDYTRFIGLSDQNLDQNLSDSLNLLNNLVSYKVYQMSEKNLVDNILIKNHFNTSIFEFIKLIINEYLFTSYKCNCNDHLNCQCFFKYINSDGYKRVLENKIKNFKNSMDKTKYNEYNNTYVEEINNIINEFEYNPYDIIQPTVNNNNLPNENINSTINNNNQQTNNENQNNNHNTDNEHLQPNYSLEINESYMDDLQ